MYVYIYLANKMLHNKDYFKLKSYCNSICPLLNNAKSIQFIITKQGNQQV